MRTILLAATVLCLVAASVPSAAAAGAWGYGHYSLGGPVAGVWLDCSGWGDFRIEIQGTTVTVVSYYPGTAFCPVHAITFEADGAVGDGWTARAPATGGITYDAQYDRYDIDVSTPVGSQTARIVGSFSGLTSVV